MTKQVYQCIIKGAKVIVEADSYAEALKLATKGKKTSGRKLTIKKKDNGDKHRS